MFRYFGFGSNMNATSLKAKGVEPIASVRAELLGWRLRFNVQHFFRHEGGVGNIEYTGSPSDRVLGVLHECNDTALPLLDAAEAYRYGYDRIEVAVNILNKNSHQPRYLDTKQPQTALTYIGMPAFINDQCLPSRRYLNIVVNGARNADLDKNYINHLVSHPIHQVEDYPIFQPPRGNYPSFNAESLKTTPLYTSLLGAVFDMSNARPQHEFLKGFFGGKDMTLFHLKRMDTSVNNESIQDILLERLSVAQMTYLNTYMNEYANEYRYVGSFNYI